MVKPFEDALSIMNNRFLREVEATSDTASNLYLKNMWDISIQNHGLCPDCGRKAELRQEVWQGNEYWKCGMCKKEYSPEEIYRIYPFPLRIEEAKEEVIS